jgi:hypothetical protein
MVMTWTSLAAPKGTAGSIANWVGYGKLDIPTIIAEAESMLYSMLRVREMRTEWVFGMAIGEAQKVLPDRFLDPVGRIKDITNSTLYPQKIEGDVNRAYEILTFSAVDNSLTPIAGTTTLQLHCTNSGINQGSVVTIAGAGVVGGLDPTGTWPVITRVDPSNLIIDVGNAVVAGATVTGGVFTFNNLLSGVPSRWSILDGMVKFDLAFDAMAALKLPYYRSPLPLSTAAPTNFLTSRYPKLMRVACLAAASDFMKDDTEYSKNLTALTALVQSTMAENDLIYRGSDIETDTPSWR